VHCSSDRYVNDGTVCQAIGQMLSRIGIATKVQTMPSNVYFGRALAPKAQFQLMLYGWGSASTGDAIPGLTGILHSYDKAKGLGAYNAQNYSSPETDKLIEKAIVTLDEGERDKLLQQAMAAAIKDYAIIPLHTQMSVAAARKGIVYTPRADEQTVAMHAKPAK
jgi:peptide/nickel transport system substrate-binding protein